MYEIYFYKNRKGVYEVLESTSFSEENARPLRDRIFFVTWEDDSFVLLHHFQKKTQRTPRREIEQALREIEDLKKRGL